jgi:hydrogenase expression/formation protein HypC
MCLAMPAQIVRILDNQKAIVQLGGIEKEISTILVEDISVNDYVIIHVGYALTKLNENEAKKTLSLFEEMQRTD